MSTELKVYRRSELEAISDGCLKRYHDLWVQGVDDSSDIALLGIGFAAVKHQYLLLLVANHIPQDQDLALSAFVSGVASVQTPARLIPELRELWMFHAEKYELPLEQYVTSEERGSSGSVGFAPDCVLAHPLDNRLEVIDDKSGWMPPRSEEDVRKLFQARVYSRYARDRWPGFSKYQFTIHAVRFNVSTSVIFTHEELDTVDVEIAAAIATIEDAHRTGSWPAVAGPSCHFCELACPIADQAVTLPKRLSLAQYQDLGAWLLVADKQLRSAKKAMKAAVNVYGPCDVNGVVWDNRQTIARSYPAKAVVNALEKVARVGGLDPIESEQLTFSHSALKGVFKRFPLIEEELTPLVQSKPMWRFAAKQQGALDEGDEE